MRRHLAILAAAALALAALAPGARATPVIFVHGIDGDPSDWAHVIELVARGRPALLEVYAGDTDALATGSLPADAIVNFGYYREKKTSPDRYQDRLPQMASIGGCPVARTDPSASRYTISYAAQLDRAVENVCRATGEPRVDVVAFSMGGLVARSYARWRSLKAPGGLSRVRRLLTVSSPNHGINSLEATASALFYGVTRPEVPQGEAAELNYECRYWGGRSLVERLDDGWDAFCQQAGIDYAAGYGFGHNVENETPVRILAAALGALAIPLQGKFLVHPTPNFNLEAEIAEATGDGDTTVRVASARFDPQAFPHVRFNSPFYGVHSDDGVRFERAGLTSTRTEALVRAYILEGRVASGFAAPGASARVVDAAGEASWLAIDVSGVMGGAPLAAQVLTRPKRNAVLDAILAPFGIGEQAYGALLEPGERTVAIDLAADADGDRRIEVRLYAEDGVATLAPLFATVHRKGRAPAKLPAATIGAPATAAAGGLAVPVSGGTAGAELSFSLEPGPGAPAAAAMPWSAFAPGVTLSLPALAPGIYELALRARGPAGAAATEVEAARPDAIRIAVGAAGAISVTR